MKTTKKSFLITMLLIISGFSILIHAFSSGITGRTMKNGNGCDCHGATPASDVMVSINGPDTLVPGQTANYTVTISGGPLNRGGTNIAASEGVLAPVSDDLQNINGELTHNVPKNPSEGTVSFEFTYTAPENAGEQTLYANGNSVNFNGANSGDQWNFAPNKTIQITVPTGVEDEQFIANYKLEQNYPNPFNPSTKIKYTIPQSEFVSLKVYDLLGNEVADLVNEEKSAGSYEINYNAGELSSGIYFYTIQSGNFIQTKKLVLTK